MTGNGFAVGSIAMAVVAVVAIVVHGRIVALIVRRARAEDLPEIMASSAAVMVALFRAVKPPARECSSDVAAPALDEVPPREENAT